VRRGKEREDINFGEGRGRHFVSFTGRGEGEIFTSRKEEILEGGRGTLRVCYFVGSQEEGGAALGSAHPQAGEKGKGRLRGGLSFLGVLASREDRRGPRHSLQYSMGKERKGVSNADTFPLPVGKKDVGVGVLVFGWEKRKKIEQVYLSSWAGKDDRGEVDNVAGHV